MAGDATTAFGVKVKVKVTVGTYVQQFEVVVQVVRLGQYTRLIPSGADVNDLMVGQGSDASTEANHATVA